MTNLICRYRPVDYEYLNDGKIDILEFLRKNLTGRESESSFLIADQLLVEYTDDDAFVEISNLEIIVAEYDPGSLSGKIQFSFEVHYLYTCSAIMKDYKKTEKVNFSISDTASELVLFFFETPERSTDAEF